MKAKLFGALLTVCGVIHLLPLSGVLGAEHLSRLYGLSFEHADLAILMRHRSVLFGMLGAFLVVAAWRRSWQPLALLAGLLSVVSFLLLAWTTPGYGAAIGRVVAADLLALGCLLLASGLWWTQRDSL